MNIRYPIYEGVYRILTIGICCFFRLFLSSVSDAKLSLLQGGPMGDEWGKCMKRKCAIPLCMNGIAYSYNGKIPG